MPGGIRLGRIAGIEIVADWSLLIIFALVLFDLAIGVLPSWHPRWSPAMTWGVATAAAVLFFGSILLHELSHAIVGRLMGMEVRRITLFLFGGMAHLEDEPPSPKAELLMAGVGPLVSLSIGFLAIVLGVAFASGSIQLDDPVGTLARMGPVPTLLLWLGPINVILGVFNMVPGFPLDGGRVLRALIWWITKDMTKATRVAALSGQAFAALLMGFGALSLFDGSAGQGIWLLLIGWFLWRAARAAYVEAAVFASLGDTTVKDIMRRRLSPVAADLPLSVLVSDYLMRDDQRTYPVVRPIDGTIVGIVTIDEVRRVPRGEWAQTSVAHVMTPVSALEPLPEDAPATEALQRLGRKNVDQLPVVDRTGAILGWIRRQDILRWLSLNQAPSAA